MSKLQDPKRCAGCNDPRWRTPRQRYWKGKRRNLPVVHKVGDDPKGPEHYSPVWRGQAQDEARRDAVIKSFYPEQASGTTAIFNRDAICVPLSFKNNKVTDA